MIATCIDNLKSALAQTPEASAPGALDQGELPRRLEAIRLDTICLRPWDSHRYRVLALLFRLPDLRPEPRIVLLNYLHSNLDFSLVIIDHYITEETGGESLPGPDPSTGTTTTRANIPFEDTVSPPPTLPDVPPCLPNRPDDLFDRFLNWIAALVS